MFFMDGVVIYFIYVYILFFKLLFSKSYEKIEGWSVGRGEFYMYLFIIFLG